MTATNWIRSIYLYLVCIITIGVFISGSVMILNLVLREYIFGVQGNWYQNPASQCEYIITEYHSYDGKPVHARSALPPSVSTNDLSSMSPEERQQTYDLCVQRETERIAAEHRYNFADTMSSGIAMILVSLPLFWFHWRLVRKNLA